MPSIVVLWTPEARCVVTTALFLGTDPIVLMLSSLQDGLCCMRLRDEALASNGPQACSYMVQQAAARQHLCIVLHRTSASQL